MKVCFELPLIGSSEKLVCRCLGVTEADVAHVVTTFAIRTADELRAYTGAGAGCMGCRKQLQVVVDRYATDSAYED